MRKRDLTASGSTAHRVAELIDDLRRITHEAHRVHLDFADVSLDLMKNMRGVSRRRLEP